MLSYYTNMGKFLISFLILMSVFVFTKNAQAKLLPQAKKGALKKLTTSKRVGTGISVYPKLRVDKRALIVNFANLQNATNVSYALTYQTSEQQEGALGALNLSNPSNNSAELLFGTCSKNVCRYHRGISNMRLEVSYTTKSGNKYLKRFRLKV